MDKTLDLDLDELERVAREATPGEWVSFDRDTASNIYSAGNNGSLLAVCHSYTTDISEKRPNAARRKANATYIATFDPPTVLTLIAAARPAVVSDEVVERMKKLSERLMQMAQDLQDWADHPKIGGKKPMLNSHLRGKRYGYSHAAQLIDAALALLPGVEGEGSSQSQPSRTTQEPPSPTPCDLEGK